MGNLCVKRGEGLPKSSKKTFFLTDSFGRIEDHYTLGRITGTGSFGVVRKAVRISDPSRAVAIKSIDKHRVKETSLLTQELSIMCQMDHPNIVKFFEYMEDTRYLHIVMEYCSGGELFDKITQEFSLNEEVAAVYMEKILLAVNHLHKLNICHRDLKPQNFLFENTSATAELKLIDFGLSNRLSTGFFSSSTMHKLVGTPLFIAPEVIKGNYSMPSDLWSCGIIMFIMLSGKYPFNGKNTDEVFENIVKGNIETSSYKWKHISPEAKDLLQKLINTCPNERITAKMALDHPWIADKNSRVSFEIPAEIVSSLGTFRTSTKMKGIALGTMVKLLDLSQIQEIKKAFYELDQSDSGYLCIDDIKQGLAPYFSEENAEKMFKNMDFNGDGHVNYSEFLAAAVYSKIETDEQLIWSTFQLFDTESSGYITLKNLKNGLKNLGVQKSKKELMEIIREVDLERNEMISFQEFKNIFQKSH